MSDLLNEREKTHGPFKETARVYGEIIGAFRSFHEGCEGTEEVHCAADMIAMKLARICAGNPMEPDHWRDIAGYAELALRSIEEAK